MTPETFFKCLSDPTRMRCLMLLQERETLCVCDIAETLESAQPKISRHLAQLRACGLVSDHRKGQWVYYRLHPELSQWQCQVLASTRTGLKAEHWFEEDLQRLQAVETRKPESRCA